MRSCGANDVSVEFLHLVGTFHHGARPPTEIDVEIAGKKIPAFEREGTESPYGLYYLAFEGVAITADAPKDMLIFENSITADPNQKSGYVFQDVSCGENCDVFETERSVTSAEVFSN